MRDPIKPIIDLRTFLEDTELHWIEEALKISKGCRTRAAALLCLNRTTLVEKMRRYRILKTTPIAKR